MPELRRQQRIVYHTRVRLRAPGREQSVIARVQNLSTRGIFVTGPEIPEAGTEVQCRMVLGGQRRTLRGRVAWVRTPSSADRHRRDPGAGIEFIELGATDADLLRGLTEPTEADHQPVDVWFEGLKAPIRSHAVVHSESLQISTKLPFLRLSSQVKVSFKRLGIEEIREGTLDSVTLAPSGDDGIPHLRLHVSTPIADSAQGTIEVPEAGRVRTPPEGVLVSQPSTVVDMTVVSPPPVPPELPAPVATGPHPLVRKRGSISEADRTQRFERPERPELPKLPKLHGAIPGPLPSAGDQTQRMPMPMPAPPNEVALPVARVKLGALAGARRGPNGAVMGFAFGALAVIIVGGVHRILSDGASEPHRAPQVAATGSEAAAPRASVVAATGSETAATVAPAPAPAAATPPAGAAMPTEAPKPRAAPPSVPPAAAANAASPPAATHVTIEPLGAAAARGGADAADGEGGANGSRLYAERAGGGSALTVFRENGATVIVLPISGSLRGLDHYALAEPPGTAVNAPRAKARVSPGTYRLATGPVRQIWIRPRGPGLHVRFFHDPDTTVGDVRVDGTAIQLIVTGRGP